MNDLIKIHDENEIDWNELWIRKMAAKGDNKRDWTKAAVKYRERNSRDNYTDRLISNLILSREYTLLDAGCGEGSITIPLSRHVRSVHAIDSNDKMLELLKKRSEGIENIKISKDDINLITKEKYGSYDIVLASRVANGIQSPKDVFYNLNEIAEKYVFVTIFGPDNWKLQEDFNKAAGRKNEDFPKYTILLNILAQMGIYANAVNMDVGPVRQYNTIEEAMDNGKWRTDSYSSEEKEILKEFLEKTLKRNPENGMLSNPYDKPDWILIWWKKKD